MENNQAAQIKTIMADRPETFDSKRTVTALETEIGTKEWLDKKLPPPKMTQDSDYEAGSQGGEDENMDSHVVTE